MDVDAFWELIERSRQETSDQDARLEWLQRQLARQPTAEIVDFQVWLDRARRRADTWDMWGAAYLLCDSLCSGDGFWYFQVWLIGLGRDAFERAVADPDNLASLPEVVGWQGGPWRLVERRLAGLGSARQRRLGGLRAGHRGGGRHLRRDGGPWPPQPLRPRSHWPALGLRGPSRSHMQASPTQLDVPPHRPGHARPARP
jgi:Protein of unknown function (DUF4240)